MYCAKCGKEIPNDAKVCPECKAQQNPQEVKLKFCQHCGEQIDIECVVCPKCGRQVSQLKSEQPQVVINNSNMNTNSNVNTNVNGFIKSREKNKWGAVLLCLFLGFLGAHKFYEGKVGMGILYIFTAGLFGIGAIVDFIVLLFKPNPYYV